MAARQGIIKRVTAKARNNKAKYKARSTKYIKKETVNGKTKYTYASSKTISRKKYSYA